LDQMLENKGYYRGNAVLVSGSAGSGKTSVGAQFADSICRSGKRALFLSFEESEQQIMRNMKSIGLDLKKWADKGLLLFASHRGSFFGLEMHLVSAHDAINKFKPDVVIMDPITTFLEAGTLEEAKAMLARLMDYGKNRGITFLLTDLTIVGYKQEATEIGISSLCDVWIKLNMVDEGNSKKRRIHILKARGLNHSHETMDLVISSNGLSLRRIQGQKRDEDEK
ncbi:MAG: ATPase domain-containing protein, partial [Candidatus Omnitrophica bacterium]|nr:ATPase domain-containing protein [Candidatus Omnitrophota bacterium]